MESLLSRQGGQFSIDAQRRFVRVVQDLSFARDVETVRGIVRTAARALTGADGATFVLKDGEYCHYVDEDAIGPLWKGRRFPMSACISGWAMIHRQAAVVEDIYKDDRIPIDAYSPTFVQSLLMVPVRETDPIGAIGIYWARTYRATPDEMELLQALANTTAVALENVSVYRELELRVEQRTAQLQAVNEELESFAHSVSHDLRAPLRHISGFAGLLRTCDGGRLSPHGLAQLDRIDSSAAKMSRLIDDILQFSRLGRTVSRKGRISLRVVDEAYQQVALDAVDRPIEWTFPPDIEVAGDPALLRQVMVNLLSNAVKYTRGCTPARIEIRAEVREGASEVTVSIKDNGAGFDMKYADRLFGPFQRLHRAEDFEGTGVGLATVRRIVHAHGGRVWADAVPGGGATFFFTLPMP